MFRQPLALVLFAAALPGFESGALAQPKTSAPAAQPTAAQPIKRSAFIAQMDAQFGKIDGDKDGRLSRLEIEQYQQLQAAAEARERNRALFTQLDTDGNGQVSAAEFAKLIVAPPAADAGPMLSREDANRDGTISLVEHRAATLANFDRLDRNRDGVVTPAEMRAGGISPP